MMTTFATLFSGGELAGVGIRAAGLVHKWAAAGAVDEAELAAVYELLEAAGLRGWLDDLLGVR